MWNIHVDIAGTDLVAIAFDTADEKWICLVECDHEAMQRLLELSSDREGLLARTHSLHLAVAITLSATCQSLHCLQILEAFLSSLTRSE
jgi:hypothetical protein